jgi:hypothetical protein
MTTAYKIAVLLLKRDRPIPLDLAARLIAEGHDLHALERRHG